MTERRNERFYIFTGDTNINRKIRAGLAAIMLATAPLISSPIPPRVEPESVVRTSASGSSEPLPDSV